ncbi:MAG: glycoside hydrolase, partial [Terracidiphilus sp.]
MRNPVSALSALLLLLPFSAAAQPPANPLTTAWRDGHFQVDFPGVVGRSDLVLQRPNLDPAEAMPLGNGNLGVAVWSENGLTAQLNRNDTMPGRLSAGQIVLPGLATLSHGKGYSARLDLYHGEFREQGGGLAVTCFVEPETDALIIDVTGANPGNQQTVLLKLWAPRTPHAAVSGPIGLLAESWLDDKNPGASGRAFGSLAALTAEGRDVSAAVTDP